MEKATVAAEKTLVKCDWKIAEWPVNKRFVVEQTVGKFNGNQA